MTAYEKARRFYFVLSIVLSLLLIGGVYFISGASSVYRIAVEGNRYLKDEDIIELSGLSDKSKYLLLIPMNVQRKIESDPLIESAKVERLDGRLVRISVKEKKILGYAPENGLNVLILENGEKMGIGKKNMYLISCGPYIEGFDEEGMNSLIHQMSKCEAKVIEQISEIHRFPQLKYQDVEIIMRDGNYVFTSVYGIELLEHYFDIQSSYASSKNSWYYFEDISGNAYTSACPWEKTEEEVKQPDQESEELEENA